MSSFKSISVNIKRFKILLIIFIFPFVGFAQKFNYGVTFGFTNNEIFYTKLQPSTVFEASNFSVKLTNGYSAGLVTKFQLDHFLDFSVGGEIFIRRFSTMLGNKNSVYYAEEFGNLHEFKFPLNLTYKRLILDDNTLFWNNFGGISFTYLAPYNHKYNFYHQGKSGEVNTMLEQSDGLGFEILLGTGINKQFNKFGSLVMGLTYHFKAGKDISQLSYYKINSDSFISSNSFRASYFSLDLTFFLRKNQLEEVRFQSPFKI